MEHSSETGEYPGWQVVLTRGWRDEINPNISISQEMYSPINCVIHWLWVKALCKHQRYSTISFSHSCRPRGRILARSLGYRIEAVESLYSIILSIFILGLVFCFLSLSLSLFLLSLGIDYHTYTPLTVIFPSTSPLPLSSLSLSPT